MSDFDTDKRLDECIELLKSLWCKVRLGKEFALGVSEILLKNGVTKEWLLEGE